MKPHRSSFPSLQRCLTTTLFAFTLLIVSGCNKGSDDNHSPKATVIVQRVRSDSTVSELWNGSVRTRDQARLAFTVSGRLQSLHVEVGDLVEAGMVLAELDQEPFLLALSQAEAELQAASPLLTETSRRRESEEKLLAQGATSRSDFDAAVSAFSAAQARLRGAEAAFALAKRHLRESKLIAPSRGRIAQRHALVAAWMDPGVQVLDFDPEGPAEVLLTLPSSRLSQLQLGAPLIVHAGVNRLNSPQYNGLVSHIGQRSLPGGVHEVLVRLAENAKLFPGQVVTVSLPASTQHRGVPLPVSALLASEKEGQGFAFVYQPATESLEKRLLHHGAPHGSEVSVSDGLYPGELIVISGTPFLHKGQKVRVQLRE